jgi:hypothetical protein
MTLPDSRKVILRSTATKDLSAETKSEASTRSSQ